MTASQLTTMNDLLMVLTLSSDPKEGLEYWPALNALLAEREKIVGHCKRHNHSGVSPGAQAAYLKILELAGEHKEANA